MQYLRLVCAHHKGGVGKTTLAVHTAALLADGIDRTLLMDCDSQDDSFYFFAREYPAKQGDIFRLKGLDVYYNRDRVRLTTLSNYDHLVVDIDTALTNAMSVIATTTSADDSFEVGNTIELSRTLEGKARLQFEATVVRRL